MRTLSLVLLAVAFAITVWLPFGVVTVRARRRWVSEVVFLLFMAACTAYLVVWQADHEFIFVLLAIAAAVAVRAGWALSMIFAVAISGALMAGFASGSLDTGLFLGFSTLTAGVGIFLVLFLVGLIGELNRAQERLAAAAVTAERLRFSRDLHDLLGHTLSVIVVKSEAIRRLLGTDQDAATGHARDIETIGRQALTEVREAVTGYRSVSLGEELTGARAALSAANIDAHITSRPREFDRKVDALLGWVVREGTTNVLRHAEANSCTITVSSDRGVARVEIVDNGGGSGTGDGTGLRGLRERVEDLDGELSAIATLSGFRLAVSVPEQVLAR
ncbi:MAG: histidine kinase [Leifsonia sp.]